MSRTKKNKTSKKSKCKRKTCKRSQKVKVKVEILDIRQITITDPMITAIKKFKPETDVSKFTKFKGEQGVPLTRTINRTIKTKPISVKPIKNRGKQINGVMKQLYEIIDGRHRVSNVIAKGLPSIEAEIV